MSQILLTNIVVAHDSALLNEIEIECPSHSCEVRLIDFSNSKLEHPYSSNQLAEARQYMAAPPSSIATKFVSFSSYRMPEKTNGQIGHHDMCKLLKHSNTKNVYAPYLIINSLERLLRPTADAPPYAFDIPPIYEDLLRLWPADFAASSSFPSDVRRMPMCNSFMCSLDTYTRFYPFVKKIMDDCWRKNEFSFDWKSTWSAVFPDRETALLIERASALWFSQQKDLKIYGPNWGSGFPKKVCNFHPRSLGWRNTHSKNLDNGNLVFN